MRDYHDNSICPEEQTNERGGRTAQKYNAFADIVKRRSHKDVATISCDICDILLTYGGHWTEFCTTIYSCIYISL